MDIKTAIKYYPLCDCETRKTLTDIIGDYYHKNLPDYLKYIENGMYDDPGAPQCLCDLKDNMEQIEKLLKEETVKL